MKTQTLFYDDPYCSSAQAIITSINDNNVTFNKTCFYPEAGGQPGDSGKFDNIRITNTIYENGNNSIIHIFEDVTSLDIGKEGKMILNWDKRYMNMKLHSALHILYLGFIEIHGNAKVRGAIIEHERARLDLEFFNDIQIEAVSDFVNNIISSSCDIITYPDTEKDNIRYWKIQNYPPIPCGGTHIKNSNELSFLNYKVKSKGKQGKRIYISFQE